MKMIRVLIALLAAMVSLSAFAQVEQIKYDDISQRRSRREPKERKPTGGPTATNPDQTGDKKDGKTESKGFTRSADSDKKAGAGNKATAGKSDKASTGTAAALKNNPKAAAAAAIAAGKKQGRPGAQPSQGAATSGGRTEGTEITQVMIDSIKTRKVDFDAEAAAENPGVILLNPRKFQKGGDRSAGSLVQPL